MVTAKLINITQQNKNANSYASGIEELAKILQSGYISDGLPIEVTSIYAPNTAVNAIIKMPLMKRLDS